MAEETPLFPLNTVLFPGMPLPLHIFEPRYREMIGLCSSEERPFGVVLIREGMEVGAPALPFEVGTLARIVAVNRLEDGRMNIVTVGTERFRLIGYSAEKRPYIVGEIEPIKDEPSDQEAARALAQVVGISVQRYVALTQAAAEQELTPLQLPSDPEDLSYLVGAVLRIRNRERQQLLEMRSTVQRLTKERDVLKRETQGLQEFLERRKGSLGPFSRN